jgi:two-component system sensor histidine kinase KdpD
MEESRPNPDELLASLKKEEQREKRGRLRVYLGMCAGVGKTYAMLEAGTRARWEGVDAIIGFVETHGRFETAALVDSLPRIPRKKIEHRGVELTELDLDAVLARRPKLVLVDELAHTNAASCRHPKRWQDVFELLDAGIDVYTTVNAQHVESRRDAVEKITGQPVRETIPDSVLDRADEIEVVDISPAELLQRLAEGKVYQGEKALRAAENFFKPDSLTALREIALRLTAERVDKELRDYSHLKQAKGVWNINERVMVAISASPFSEKLIRAACRLALSLRAPWLAVHVNQGDELNPSQREQLRKNLALAEELGAEVVTASEIDLARAIKQIAATRNVSQVVVGRPARRFGLFESRSLFRQLTREAGDFDIHVVREEAPRPKSRFRPRSGLFQAPGTHYWYTLWIMALVAGVGPLVELTVGYHAVGFFFLCCLLALSLFYSLGPVLFGAVLGTLLWDFFFIPPRFTFYISRGDDYLMIVAFFLSAVVTGLLTARLRQNQRLLREKSQRTDLLYRLVSAISTGQREEKLAEVADMLGAALGTEAAVFLSREDDALSNVPYSRHHFLLHEKDLAVASWALKAGKPAGWSTSNLPSSTYFFAPLPGDQTVQGLLVCRARSAAFSLEEEELIQAAARQLALSLEKEMLQDRSREADLLRESEQLHQALLNSVSHELRTPLTALLGSAGALKDDSTASDTLRRQVLIKEIFDAGERLNRVIENLLDMARLNSGMLALKKEWQDPTELVNLTLRRVEVALHGRAVKVTLPDGLPLVEIDYRLVEHALANLLVNAATYTPAGTEIEVTAQALGTQLQISVSDRGPGIPQESLSRIFERFYRIPGTPAGGTGLGLYISRSLAQAHGGELRVRNREGGGAQFTLVFPLSQAPRMPAEAA